MENCYCDGNDQMYTCVKRKSQSHKISLYFMLVILLLLFLVTVSYFLLLQRTQDIHRLQQQINDLRNDFDKVNHSMLGFLTYINMNQDKLQNSFEFDELNFIRKKRQLRAASIEDMNERRHQHIRSYVQYRANERSIKMSSGVNERVHYLKNKKIRHTEGYFFDWLKDDISTNPNIEKKYSLRDGVVHVKDGGVYFVYAQILYDDAHDLNGYCINKNNEPIFQCTTTARPFTNTTILSNTSSCFTGGIVHLRKNDTITIKDIHNNRIHIFTAASTYFGLIKL